jgi:hypothetical protein
MFVGPEHVLGIGTGHQEAGQSRQAQCRGQASPGYERAAWLLTYGRSDARAMWITVMAVAES